MSARATPLHDLTLRFRQVTIRVSAEPSDLEWLREFVQPQFVEVQETADREVKLKLDEPLYRRLQGAGPRADTEPIGCFAFDNALLKLPVWSSPDDRRVIFDDKHKAFYLIAPDGASVTVLRNPDGHRGRIPLMRIVREWAMSHGARAGGLFLHASSFAVGDRGVVVAGEKAAGKTTTLIHSLRHPATSYVSNDRVFVSFDQGGTTFTGIPTIATIRETMLPFFPGLQERLPTTRFAHHRRMSAAYEGEAPMRPWGDGRYGLTPAQFTHALDTPAAAGARAHAIVLPRVTGEPGTLELSRLDPQEALNALADAIFGVGAWSELGEVFVAPPVADEPPYVDPRDLCARLVSEVPAYDCALGLQAYDAPATADKLIAGAFGASTASH